MKQQPLLDLLVARYPEESRESLLSWVLCGEVFVEGHRTREPKRKFPADAAVERRSAGYVSRAGSKLEAALTDFAVEIAGKVFLDVGAATGGFTDCLLQHGAAHVHAVDVAHNMLDYRLRTDPRVTAHERVNARSLPPLDPVPHAVVCDVSFRSLRGIAGQLIAGAEEGWGIFLVKPQFELAASSRLRETTAGEEAGSGFDGVVRSREDALGIVGTLLRLLEQEERVFAHRIIESPVRGRRGNTEFLALLKRERGPGLEAVFS